jgi:hypothetical protein
MRWLITPLVGILLAAAPSAQAFTIHLIFDPAHPDSSGPFQAAEEAVIRQAAKAWETFIISPGGVSILALKSGIPAQQSLLGLARNYQSSGGIVGGLRVGTPLSGDILLNDAAPWFVDPTPADHLEFQSQASAPATFLTAKPGGPAAGQQYDLLSVALHEIGHVLGITSAYESFFLNVQGSPDTPQQVYVFAGPPTLGDPLADYRAGFFLYGGVYLPQSEDNAEEAGSFGSVPSHLDDVDFGGAAAGLFPYDLMNQGINFEERRLISFVDLDILADSFGYMVTPEPSTWVLLAAGLAAFLGTRRRTRR